MTTTKLTKTDLQISDAAEILELHDIELFEIEPHADRYAAWSVLEREHGERIAMMQRQGDRLVISWHYNHKPVAWWIRQAFRAVGLRATWGGDIRDAVHVELTPHYAEMLEKRS